jgi:hypothetical protein
MALVSDAYRAVSTWQRSCIGMGVRFVICFVPALASLTVNTGKPLCGTRGYPGPRSAMANPGEGKGRKNRIDQSSKGVSTS